MVPGAYQSRIFGRGEVSDTHSDAYLPSFPFDKVESTFLLFDRVKA